MVLSASGVMLPNVSCSTKENRIIANISLLFWNRSLKMDFQNLQMMNIN